MTTKTSDTAVELAQTIINDGQQYKARCDLARRDHTVSDFTSPSLALAWMEHARRGAHDYCRAFPGVIFTPADILGAALELADYYATHVKEMD